MKKPFMVNIRQKVSNGGLKKGHKSDTVRRRDIRKIVKEISEEIKRRREENAHV